MFKGGMFMILALFSNELAFQYNYTVAVCGLS